jgi:hypothetical protein
MNVDLFIGRLRQKLMDLQASALHVPASDYAAYREMVGRAAGLNEALSIIEELTEEDE